jgi:molybdopterin-guanine dinucleotide biosynthesis protein A
MGRDKALLPIGGVPLARRTALTLLRAGCVPVSLVGNQPALAELGLPVLREPETSRHHPLIGVAAVLEQAQGLSLFAPCDLPHLTTDAILRLLAHGGPCVAAGQPLLCILPSEMATAAAEQARSGGSARAFVAALPTITIEASALHNANTPGDLQ